jgi:hypothetical protein
MNSVIIAFSAAILCCVILRFKVSCQTLTDKETNKIAEELKFILCEHSENTDNVETLMYTPYIMIGDKFTIKIKKRAFAFLIEYLFRKRNLYILINNKKNRGKGEVIGKFLDLKELVDKYLIYKKKVIVEEKMKALQDDFE